MNKLKELRSEIDAIDSEIVRLLNDRLSLVLQVKETKKNLKIPIEDLGREQEILQNIEPGNLDKDFLKKLYDIIFLYSKQKQNNN